MLPNTLNTNEVKDAAGVEEEFYRSSQEGRTLIFSRTGASPAYPHQLIVSHVESGSGLRRIRRSLKRVNLTIVSDIDDVTPITISAYTVLSAPVGAMGTTAPLARVLANLGSFGWSLGIDSTIKFDGTGNGCSALINGSL